MEANPAVSEIRGHSGCRIPDYFSTDTSEVEKLFDSSGAEEPTLHRSLATINMDALSQPVTSLPEPQTPEGKTKVDVIPAIPVVPKQISASGRTLLRKYFSENSPVELPNGHSTVAFSESQVDTLLRVMTEETMISSYDMVKELLEKMTLVGMQGRSHTKQTPRRQISVVAGNIQRSSGDECSGNTTDDYTSGAFNTDDDIRGLDSSQGSEVTSRGAYTPTI